MSRIQYTNDLYMYNNNISKTLSPFKAGAAIVNINNQSKEPFNLLPPVYRTRYEVASVSRSVTTHKAHLDTGLWK